MCRALCEIHYSGADDSLTTIKQIRIINAVGRAKCAPYGLLRDCRSLVK